MFNSDARFSQIPSVKLPRNQFMKSPRHLTTLTAGRLVPLFWEEILPGDTVSMDTAFVCRMLTPLYPTMDNCVLDLFWFFCPNRLLWTHWKNFMGENTESAWTPQTEYIVPAVKGVFNKGSVADYFGVPTNTTGPIEVNALPFRAYVEVWNEWFRAQQVQAPAYTIKGDEDVSAESFDPANDIVDGAIVQFNTAYKGGCLLPLNKFHDMFTSMLPEPQFGSAVEINIASDNVGFVYPSATDFADQINALYSGSSVPNVNMATISSGALNSEDTNDYVLNVVDGNLQAKDYGTTDGQVTGPNVVPTNLAVKNSFVSTTINDLRQAFAVQRLLEKDARGGSRYAEILVNHFGTRPIDAVIQRPQYLGGFRTPINIDQVVQTSSTDSTSPQGNTGAFSLTGNRNNSFTASFQEHGILILVGGVRTEHTYQQSLYKAWSRRRKYDYYWPALANLGESPVLAKELVATGTLSDDNVIGYQEAWYDYRYRPSYCSGAFRSNVTGSLDSWHYADYFDPANQPILSSAFLTETASNIDRTLAVSSELEDQFLLDLKFNGKFVRTMPLYSIPGGMYDRF